MNQDERQPLPTREPKGWIARLGKDAIFWTLMVYAGLMLTVAVLHRTNVIDLFQSENFLVPLAIPWFGAMGAILVSLQAIFERREDWDPSYNYWHLGRPIVGALFGVLSFLILSLIVTLAGSTPPAPNTTSTIASLNLYHVLAFMVGYREATFRNLLKRVR